MTSFLSKIKVFTHPSRIQGPLTVYAELVLVLSLRQVHDSHKVFLTAFEKRPCVTFSSADKTQACNVLWGLLRESIYLLLSGILVAQLLKEPDTKTSLAPPDHLNTVGLACVGLLLSLSRSCCQARNSCISCGAWTAWYQRIVAMLMRAASASTHTQHFLTEWPAEEGADDGACFFFKCSFSWKLYDQNLFIYNRQYGKSLEFWHICLEILVSWTNPNLFVMLAKPFNSMYMIDWMIVFKMNTCCSSCI